MTPSAPLLGCLVIAALPAFAPAQGVVFREDFESGASGWTFGASWHVESDTTTCGSMVAPFPSAGHCAWYGSQTPLGWTLCNYSQNWFGGDLVLASPIVLPANLGGSLALRYRRFLQTEQCIEGYDLSLVRITTNAGQTQLAVGSDCGGEAGWSDRRLDLTPFAGSPVELRFIFEPRDGTFNETLGWWLDDIEIAVEPGVVTCVAGPICPCSAQYNALPGGAGPALANEDSGGCKHSGYKEARLFGNGVQSVAADTVELVAHDLPPSTIALFVQGLTTQSVPFGDGRRCMGGPFVRMAIHGVANGQDSYPHVGEAGIASSGSVPAAGGMRTYQVVYRDAASYCTSSTFNTSNGYVIAWRP